jgi:dihydroorotate dehydrogenase (fumarate)
LTTGVHTVTGVVKGIAAGAAVTMMTSELLQHGINRLRVLRSGLEAWLVEREYESLDQLRGSLSQLNSPEPAAFERANYMRVLSSYSQDYLWRSTPVGLR